MLNDLFRDPGRFKDLSAGLQSVVIILALAIGGAWTLYYTLAVRQEGRLALSEYESTQRILAEIDLKISRLPLASDSSCHLSVRAVVQNKGRRAVRLDFTKAPALRAASTSIEPANRYSFTTVATASPFTFTRSGKQVLPLERVTLLPGESGVYSFVLRLENPGLYFLEFNVPIEEQLPDMPHVDQPSGWAWTTRRFVSACPTEADADAA